MDKMLTDLFEDIKTIFYEVILTEASQLQAREVSGTVVVISVWFRD